MMGMEQKRFNKKYNLDDLGNELDDYQKQPHKHTSLADRLKKVNVSNKKTRRNKKKKNTKKTKKIEIDD